METFDLLLPVISALAGVLIGGGGVLAVLSRANANVPLKDSTERLLYNSIPVDVLKLIQQGAGVVRGAAEFVMAVTDGETNTTDTPDSQG